MADIPKVVAAHSKEPCVSLIWTVFQTVADHNDVISDVSTAICNCSSIPNHLAPNYLFSPYSTFPLLKGDQY